MTEIGPAARKSAQPPVPPRYGDSVRDAWNNGVSRTELAALPSFRVDLSAIPVTAKPDLMKLLRFIASKSDRTPGQISTYSGLNRSTVYNYLKPTYEAFPHKGLVVKFCRGCGLPEDQIAQVTGIWDRLNGTVMITQTTPEPVFDAELVEPDGPPGDDARHINNSSSHATTITGGSHHVAVDGSVRGDVNITINQGDSTEKSTRNLIRASARVAEIVLLGVFAFITVRAVNDALQAPREFGELAGAVYGTTALVLCVVIAMLGLATRADDLKEPHEFKELRRLIRAEDRRRTRITTVWPVIRAGVAITIMAAAVGHDVYRASFDLSHPAGWAAPVLSGLIVWVMMMTLISVGTRVYALAGALVELFPVLVAMTVVSGIFAGFVATSSAGFPIASSVLVGVLVAGLLSCLWLVFLDHVVMEPTLAKMATAGYEPDRYTQWVADSIAVARQVLHEKERRRAARRAK